MPKVNEQPVDGEFEPSYIVTYLGVISELVERHGTYDRVAQLLAVNRAYIWRAVHLDQMPRSLIYALAREDYIERPEPVDPRNRVWMRIDDEDKAVATFVKHYPHLEIRVRQGSSDELDICRSLLTVEEQTVQELDKLLKWVYIGLVKDYPPSGIMEEIKTETTEIAYTNEIRKKVIRSVG